MDMLKLMRTASHNPMYDLEVQMADENGYCMIGVPAKLVVDHETKTIVIVSDPKEEATRSYTTRIVWTV